MERKCEYKQTVKDETVRYYDVEADWDVINEFEVDMMELIRIYDYKVRMKVKRKSLSALNDNTPKPTGLVM